MLSRTSLGNGLCIKKLFRRHNSSFIGNKYSFSKGFVLLLTKNIWELIIMEKIRFEVNYIEDDVLKGTKHIMYQKLSKLQVSIMESILIFSVIFWIIIKIIKGEDIAHYIPIIIFFLGVIFFVLNLFKKSGKEVFNTNKLLQSLMVYEISEEGLYIESENGNSLTKWTGFYNLIETEDTFGLYVSNSAMYIIPKRCLINISEEEKEFLRKCLSNIQVKPQKNNKIRWLKKTLVLGLLFYIVLFLFTITIIFFCSRTIQ